MLDCISAAVCTRLLLPPLVSSAKNYKFCSTYLLPNKVPFMNEEQVALHWIQLIDFLLFLGNRDSLKRPRQVISLDILVVIPTVHSALILSDDVLSHVLVHPLTSLFLEIIEFLLQLSVESGVLLTFFNFFLDLFKYATHKSLVSHVRVARKDGLLPHFIVSLIWEPSVHTNYAASYRKERDVHVFTLKLDVLPLLVAAFEAWRIDSYSCHSWKCMGLVGIARLLSLVVAKYFDVSKWRLLIRSYSMLVKRILDACL